MADDKNLTYYDKMIRNVFPTRICPVCGKTIIRICFGDYAYKMDGHIFCSWTCLRKYEKGECKITKPSPLNKNLPLADTEYKRKKKKKKSGANKNG